MRVHTIQRKQCIQLPLQEVFRFFSNPENLGKITPGRMGFIILTPTPITMKEGAVIDYSIRIAGKRIRWTTLISEYDPPYRFVDIQLQGPYSFWHHKHSFHETDDGTRIEDEVRYVMPFGIAGELAHSILVKKQLENIFNHRSGIIEQIFSGNGQRQLFQQLR